MKQTKDSTEMGENRTGIAMDPAEARKTAQGAQVSATRGDERAFAEARVAAATECQGIGSLPKPARNGNGRKPSRNGNLRLLLDKLSEREAFERTGVRLYDSMIVKVQALGGRSAPPLEELQRIRAEELAHFHLVADQLKRLGGDDTAESPCADVTGVASRGLLQVLADPRTSISQALSMLLTAELTDNAGWELLIELCGELDMPELGEQFSRALAEEVDHLEKVRMWVSEGLKEKLE